MNFRILGISGVILAALVTSTVVSGCDQIQVECQVGHANYFPYAATYTKVSGDAACPAVINEPLGLEDYHPAVPGTETRNLDVSTVYVAANFDDTIINPAECYAAPDKPVGYAGGAFTDPDKSHSPFSIGVFDSINPDANDMCHVPSPSIADYVAPAVPATTAGTNPAGTCFSPSGGCSQQPDGTFDLSCLCAHPTDDDCCDDTAGQCVYSCTRDLDCCEAGDTDCQKKPKKGLCSAGPGQPIGFCTKLKSTACTADAKCKATDTDNGTCQQNVVPESCHTSAVPQRELKYTWSTLDLYTTAANAGLQMASTVEITNTCGTATYSVRAVWPGVSCARIDVNGSYVDANDKPTGTPIPNPNACCPNADAKHGSPTGSGISPDFAVHCDPDSLLCVLDSDVPALNGRGYPDGCAPPEAIPNSED